MAQTLPASEDCLVLGGGPGGRVLAAHRVMQFTSAATPWTLKVS